METMLLIGRWNGMTRDQETVLRRRVQECAPRRLFFAIAGADQAGTKRYPLSVDERQEVVKAFAEKLNRYHEIFRIADLPDSTQWVARVEKTILDATQGRTKIDPTDTTVMSANLDVLKPFESAGYQAIPFEFVGRTPADLIAAILSNKAWTAIANEATTKLYQAKGVESRLRVIFGDIQLTDEGELSHNRDFVTYAAGMDASLEPKLKDILPHVRPGKIVDKGCGTGALLVELSKLHPTSQIVGMDLSREFVRVADGLHYPNQNVSIVRANIVHRHFPPGSVNTILFSSVMHEVYSYSGYNRDVVRLALSNSRDELELGGVVIIRDGVKPPERKVWMRLDGEAEGRFRRFVKEFKGQGIRYEERELLHVNWFLLGMHEANEFLSKKDYLANWDAEVKEEFGVFTLEEWKKELTQAGYRVRVAKSYLNPWIEKNRYEGKAWLYADKGAQHGEELPFPDTTMLITAEAV